jgi:hypothetical protein
MCVGVVRLQRPHKSRTLDVDHGAKGTSIRASRRRPLLIAMIAS